jgi:hypothetical protein
LPARRKGGVGTVALHPIRARITATREIQ